MKNKIQLLLMSCNQPLYLSEEQACRDTFIKDAEGAGIPYWFYRGGSEANSIDSEHVMHLSCPDGLAATSVKTVLAMAASLGNGDWDYLVKTNVSTWLNIGNIVDAVDKWPGRNDTNIYGARYIANKSSKNVPFPRGNFVIYSRAMVEGIVKWSRYLLSAPDYPKTDDTLLGLTTLYHITKEFGLDYLKCLMEVPSVISYPDKYPVQDSPEFTEAMSVRCKDEANPENTPDNMRKVHETITGGKYEKAGCRPVWMVETPYGCMDYRKYENLLNLISAFKAVNGQEAVQSGNTGQQSCKPD